MAEQKPLFHDPWRLCKHGCWINTDEDKRAWNCRECPECRSRKSAAAYRANPEPVKARSRQWNADNAKRKSETGRKYREMHKERIATRKKQEALDKPEIVKARKRANYLRTRGEKIAYSKQWRLDNPEKHREHNRTSKAARRMRLDDGVCVHGRGCFARAATRMPQKCVCCSATDNITADHIVPLARGGLDCRDNLQPMCGTCNSSKQDGDACQLHN